MFPMHILSNLSSFELKVALATFPWVPFYVQQALTESGWVDQLFKGHLSHRGGGVSSFSVAYSSRL